jgi:ATP-dependent DNA ligase
MVKSAASTSPARPTFRDLIFRKRQPIFIAFDLLYLHGKDLRTLPLIERKAMLKRLIRRKRALMFYLDHVGKATGGCSLKKS